MSLNHRKNIIFLENLCFDLIMFFLCAATPFGLLLVVSDLECRLGFNLRRRLSLRLRFRFSFSFGFYCCLLVSDVPLLLFCKLLQVAAVVVAAVPCCCCPRFYTLEKGVQI